MLRNNQLLSGSRKTQPKSFLPDSLPVAVLAIDNAIESITLRPILAKLNFRIMEAKSPAAALEVALKHTARLVVASLNLSQQSGYEFWQHLRQHKSTESTSFLFITPQGTTPDKLIQHETFASDYVQRPLDLAEFERRLNGVLRSRLPERPKSFEARPKMAPPAGEPKSNPEVAATGRPSGVRNARIWQARSTPSPNDPSPAASRIDPPPAPAARTRNPFTRTGTLEAPDPVIHEKSAVSPPDEGVMSREAWQPRKQTSPAVVEGQALPGAPATEARTPAARPVSPEPAAAEPAGGADVSYKEGVVFVLASIRRVEAGQPVDLQKGMSIARSIIEGLKRGHALLLLATDRVPEFSLAQSSVNVSIIACSIARTLGMGEHRILRVALAGLLHDIGSVKLPKNLLYKSGSFTAAERDAVERVPAYSAQILANIAGFEWLPQLVAKVNERADGEMASLGPEERELRDEADAVGIAMVFEACTHKRPNREAMTGYQTLEELIKGVHQFPDRITKAMIRSFSVYPFNEFVLLNTGEIGQVIDIHTENPMRPVVRLLFTVDKEPVHVSRVVDLAQNSSVHITRAITWRDLPSAGKAARG
ncbi:MAG: response regulator [Acidobacteria bacterium]|nr:response regulator [Acidobacteriota bacterium]